MGLGVGDLVPWGQGRRPKRPFTVSGEILFQGRDLNSLSPEKLRAVRRAKIALLPQGMNALNPLMRVGHHITETLSCHWDISGREAEERALELLKTFHLEDPRCIFRAYPFQLSGGMARRALMAITFALSPSLILTDEPTRGLDNMTRDRILQTLKKSIEKSNAGLLIVTHDLDVAATCDEVAVLHQGFLVEKTDPRTLFTSPCHAITKEMVRAVEAA